MAIREREKINPEAIPPLTRAENPGGPHREFWWRANYDLVGVVFLAVIVPLLVGLEASPWLRVPFGLVMVLFAPGYTLTEAIFTHRDDMDGAGRLALSFGLSVAALPLLALLLNALPWGIRLWPMVISLSTLTVLSVATAIFRRWWLSARNEAATPPQPHPLGWWSQQTRAARTGYLAGLAVLLLIGAYASWVFLTPNPAERLTEFYALGAEGLAENYPRETTVNEEVQLQLGIVNREGAPSRYRIEVREDNEKLAELGPINLKAGEKWEQPIRYWLAKAGDDQVVEILLFYNDSLSPYRSLKLWINVKPAQANNS